MASIPKKVSTRLSKEVGAFQKVLQAAKDRDVNESDTVTIIVDMLAAVFGYDKYAEVTSEQAIKSTYCDLAVKIDDSTKFLIEVKAIGLDLKDNHLVQAINYGANHGIDWVVLTNGIEWQIHRLKFAKPIDSELVCSIDFVDLKAKSIEDQAKLFLLCKEGFQKKAIEEYHEHCQSVNRFMIAAIVQSDAVLPVIRRELKRVTPGLQVEMDEIKVILAEEVLKRDAVTGDMADKAAKEVKKAAKTVLKKKQKKQTGSEELPEATASQS